MPTQTAALLVRCRRLLYDHRARAAKDGAVLDYSLHDIRQLIEISPCCHWCRLPLALDVSLDHVRPIARAGSHALANLVAVCRRCQALKGQLDGGEMRGLVEFLADLHPLARADIERRLLAGGKRYAGGR